jgi:hypothetical protein
MQLEADEREAFVAVLRQRGLSDGDFEVIRGSLTVTAPALLSMDDAPQYGPLTEVVVVRSRHRTLWPSGRARRLNILPKGNRNPDRSRRHDDWHLLTWDRGVGRGSLNGKSVHGW